MVTVRHGKILSPLLPGLDYDAIPVKWADLEISPRKLTLWKELQALQRKHEHLRVANEDIYWFRAGFGVWGLSPKPYPKHVGLEV